MLSSTLLITHVDWSCAGRVKSEVDPRLYEVANGARVADDEDGEVAVHGKEALGLAKHWTRQAGVAWDQPGREVGVAGVGGRLNGEQVRKGSVELIWKYLQYLRTVGLASGDCSVGRAIASNIRDPRFKSHHQPNFIYQL